MQLIDYNEVERALAVFLPAGQTTEVRALDAVLTGDRRTVNATGYFNNPAALLAALKSIFAAKGIYFIPNAVDPALLARASNRIKTAAKGDATTDANIVCRRWLLIDCDAKRPSGISATDAEHAAAMERAKAIAECLTAAGWPEPVTADSGNGAHLLYRIDLPADDGGLVQRCLAALATQFDDSTVAVDRTVFNPARIWKLYGSAACKGDSTPDRPWRMSRIISAPAELGTVPKALLDSLAGSPAAAPTPATAQAGSSAGFGSFDLAAFVARHLPNAVGPAPWKGGGRIWELPESPICDHHDGQCFVGQQPNGAIVAGCHHNSCNGRWGWKELRERFEPRGQGSAADAAGVDISAIVSAAEPAKPLAIDPGTTPASLLRVDGFVGEVIDFTLDTAPYPNAPLALAAALATQAFLASRKIRDERGIRPSIYIAAAANSGAGKEWPRAVSRRILQSCGLGDCWGDTPASGEGLEDVIYTRPSYMLIMDEVHFLLSAMKSSRETRWQGIVQILLRMFSAAGEVYACRIKSGDEQRFINQPALTWSASTIPDYFYGSLSQEALINGLLARIVVIEGAPRSGNGMAKDTELPPRIVETAAYWADFHPGAPANLATENPLPALVRHTIEAEAVLAEFQHYADEEYKRCEHVGDNAGMSIWARAGEKARRLALIYAASVDCRNPRLPVAGAQWAADFVRHQTKRMLYMAGQHVSETAFDANCQRMFRVLCDWRKTHDSAPMPHNQFRKRFRQLDTKQFDDCVRSLVDQGEIRIEERQSKGRPGVSYVAIGA